MRALDREVTVLQQASTDNFCPQCWAERAARVPGRLQGGEKGPRALPTREQTDHLEVSIPSFVRYRSFVCEDCDEHRWRTEETICDPTGFMCQIQRSTRKGSRLEAFKRAKLIRSISAADPNLSEKQCTEASVKAVQYLRFTKEIGQVDGTWIKIYESASLGECTLLALYSLGFTVAYLRYLSIFL